MNHVKALYKSAYSEIVENAENLFILSGIYKLTKLCKDSVIMKLFDIVYCFVE